MSYMMSYLIRCHVPIVRVIDARRRSISRDDDDDDDEGDAVAYGCHEHVVATPCYVTIY